MKKYVFLIVYISFLVPISMISAKDEGYKVVSELPGEKIILYAKEKDGSYRDFKLVFKDGAYSKPFWTNVTNPTYAPKLSYEDLNNDGNKELIIILTTGTGTGVLNKEVHVFDYRDEYGLTEVLVDNPLAIIHKNVKTKLTTEKAELILGNKVFTVDTKSIKPSHLFEEVYFGNIIDYEVINNKLMVRVSGQITPETFVGDIIITYEYRDEMYQAKTIEFITDMSKNPFYGPVKN